MDTGLSGQKAGHTHITTTVRGAIRHRVVAIPEHRERLTRQAVAFTRNARIRQDELTKGEYALKTSP